MATTITRQQIREGAAADLGLFYTTTADDVNTTDHTVRISDVKVELPDAHSIRDAWLMPRHASATGNAYRRIVKGWFENTPDKVQLDGGPDGLTDGQAAGIYLLLSPEDWNTCINEALADLFTLRHVSITLTENDNEYAMDGITDGDSDLCTWLQSRTQVLGTEIRTTDGANMVTREKWAGVRYIEDGNALTVHLTYMPYIGTNTTLILVCRKPYVWPGNEMDDDDDSTTCPYKLAIRGAQLQAISLLFKRHGRERMRQQFGQALAVIEKEFAQAKHRWQPAIRTQNYEIDETFGVDLPHELAYPSW